MSAHHEDAAIEATIALARAAGIPGYTAASPEAEQPHAAAQPAAWEQGLTAQERADVAFLIAAGAASPGTGA